MAVNQTPLNKDSNILIIGAGTFGISTAYHLAKRGYSNVTCIDRHPCPSLDSAGHDLNKIIRTEYEEPLYVELALEALEAWRNPEWDGIFHETGRMTITTGNDQAENHLRESYENLSKVGQAGKIHFIQGKEQILLYVPQLRDAPGIEEWKGAFNSQGGWAHARKALEKWGAEAQKMGVTFVSGPGGTMTGLQLGSSGTLSGIRVASGEVLHADRYILSTGAASPEVLPELANELWSKCWPLAHVELTDDEVAQWKGIPVVDHFEFGFTFEPDPETKLMNICDNCPGYQYRTGTTTDAAGNVSSYSIPRYASANPEDGIPAEATASINRFIDAVTPQFSGRPLVNARVCWCTDSPDSHWLIDNHPQHRDVLLATGDSGHAFKMFPIIGGYIADALEGRSRGLREEWRFGNRKTEAAATRLGTEVKDLRDV
ncbi:hypothetical protein AK830_g2803 [Neonectria ditissima]|uniref:FAD dependent oxidoreductase domain-containing protein n=1 Tax=Neonectria ditissima TaxID=78410 RepID=A0A0P7BSU4_9HYPO|nr:hypothetical protein AK830_g2803 [Neonectria ditissima]